MMDGVTGLNGEPDLRRLNIPALDGDAGGAVVDASGMVVGMLLPRETSGERVLPDKVSFALSSSAIAVELAAQGVTFPAIEREGALAPAELAERATKMTVLVSCWK